MLQRGANIDCKDKNDCTPLIYAASNGDEDLVRLLLEKGATLENEDYTASTALIPLPKMDTKVLLSYCFKKVLSSIVWIVVIVHP